MPAARFELAAHVNVHQPDSQQNKNPSPRQPDAIRDETVTLTTAAHWLRCLRSSKSVAKHKEVRTAMHDGGFAYRLHPSSLTTSWCQQSAQRETVSLSGRCVCEERTSTCGVSSSGNVKVWHGPRASQPVRNRSRAQTRSIATASK